MRFRVTASGIISITLLAGAVASADTIHLKNGRTILADHVHENGSRYEYDIGDDSYAVPKSSVERIELGGMAAGPSGGGGSRVAELPSFKPVDSLANEGDLPQIIVKEGKVDPE